MHDSPPQVAAQIRVAAKNGQQKVEGNIQSDRVCPTCSSGLCTDDDAEKGNYNDERNRGSRGEIDRAGISIWRGKGCRRLGESQSRLTKPIKAVNKLNMELSQRIVICQTLQF